MAGTCTATTHALTPGFTACRQLLYTATAAKHVIMNNTINKSIYYVLGENRSLLVVLSLVPIQSTTRDISQYTVYNIQLSTEPFSLITHLQCTCTYVHCYY